MYMYPIFCKIWRYNGFSLQKFIWQNLVTLYFLRRPRVRSMDCLFISYSEVFSPHMPVFVRFSLQWATRCGHRSLPDQEKTVKTLRHKTFVCKDQNQNGDQ